MGTKRLEFKRHGKIIVYYYKFLSARLSFYIKDEPQLTQLLLDSIDSKGRTVNLNNICHSLDFISDKLSMFPKTSEENILNMRKNILKAKAKHESPVSNFLNIYEKLYGVKLKFTCVSTGTKQIAELKLLNGRIYIGSGKGKKEARIEAAAKALEEL